MSEPLKDPDGNVYPDEVQALVEALDYSAAVDHETVIKALESVRSMEHPPNVLFFNSIRSPQVNQMIATLLDAAENHAWFRVVVDKGELKIKAGAQSWSPPFTSEEQER